MSAMRMRHCSARQIGERLLLAARALSGHTIAPTLQRSLPAMLPLVSAAAKDRFQPYADIGMLH